MLLESTQYTNGFSIITGVQWKVIKQRKNVHINKLYYIKYVSGSRWKKKNIILAL